MNSKLLFVMLISVFFIQSDLLAQTGQEANEYFSKLLEPFDDIEKRKWAYLRTVTRGKSARKVDKKRQNLLKEYEAFQDHVRAVRTLRGDTILKPAIKDYLKTTIIVIKQDYDKILDMEAIAEDSYDLMEAYLLAQELAQEKLSDAIDLLQEAQQSFCLANDILLMEAESDKRQEKIKNASNLLEYYNKAYLIFFKPYKQEAYVLDAFSRNDVTSMEQHNNALIDMAEESLESINALENYNGDGELKSAIVNIINFYKTEAEEDFGVMIDFYIKKDNFESINSKFSKIKKNKRTQADVDQYNAASTEYNKAVNNFNNVIQAGNAKRSKSLDAYNKAVNDFFNRHS